MERYESLGLVGEGSYGTVLKCRHRDSGRLVAIKKFVDSDDDKTVKKIALREIKLLRQLRHDNLVNLLEVWKRRRRWYLVFEFVERTLLDDLEQHPSGLDPNTSRQYLYQILRAAAFCHQQNIIHRDIKPENILISQGGVVKLCDFGFARTMTSPADGGVYTDYVATRWYRAPELLVGDTQYGKPVDVWAVGCLLLEMLTGQPLFPGDSDLDQIYHIVQCFGNLTAHHQELFYRNPVFSGVRLPECSGRVPMEQRFPTISPTVLDLAQSCLQMDPERRAQCSELLEHPLFTQDSFHIRVLDELNAKIQKEHRENSTLPKIAKTSRQERDEGDEKNRRGKKQPEDMVEKVNKEKEKKDKEVGEEKKTRSKQPSKPVKTARNTSEPLIATKQTKSVGSKITDNASKATVSNKSKPGKTAGAELRKEVEICKFTKTPTTDSLEATKTATGVKEHNTAVVKLKHGKGDGHSKNMDPKDRESSFLHSSCSDNTVPDVAEKNVKGVWRSLKNEPSTDFGKSWNNSNTKVPKLSKSLVAEYSNGGLSPKACFKSTTDCVESTGSNLTQTMGAVSITEWPSKISNSDQVEASLTFKVSQPPSNDHTEAAAPASPAVTKQVCERSATSGDQVDHSTTEAEQRWTSESPKVLPSNPEPAQTTSDSGPTATINNTSLSTSPSKTLSPQSSTACIGATPSHSTVTIPEGILQTGSSSDTKATNDTTCVSKQPSRGLPTNRELTEVSIAANPQLESCNTLNKEDHRCCKTSQVAENHTEICDASGGYYEGNPEPSESSSIRQQSTSMSKITAGSGRTATPMPNEIPKTSSSEGRTLPKALKVSDKENREDLSLSGSISVTKSLVNQVSKVSRSSNVEQRNSRSDSEPNIKPLKSPHRSLIGETKTKPGSFSTHSRSSAADALKTQKSTFPPEARRKRDHPEQTDTTNTATIADSASDHRASTRSSVFHLLDTADVNDFDSHVSRSSPPPPPPPPSSTPLLIPPSSTPLIPSFSIVSTSSQAAGDPFTLGASLHPGTLRCTEKPRHHAGVYSRRAQQSLSSHVTGPLGAQLSEKSPIRERSFLSDRCNLGSSGGITATRKKSDIHFPDLRSSALPELRGRDGKHNRGLSKEQRKERQPFVFPSQPHGHDSTDTQTP